jgi:hypothetical protein
MRRMMSLSFALALVANIAVAAQKVSTERKAVATSTKTAAAARFHGGSCARPIYIVPELDACAIEGRWTSSGTFHHGETIYWGNQTAGGYEFAFGNGVVELVDAARYVISVETPVASDCGMHNFATLKINGVAVHVAESYGGTRILRNLFTYVKADGETDVVSVVFTSDGDGGAYAAGAVLRIQKD